MVKRLMVCARCGYPDVTATCPTCGLESAARNNADSSGKASSAPVSMPGRGLDPGIARTDIAPSVGDVSQQPTTARAVLGFPMVYNGSTVDPADRLTGNAALAPAPAWPGTVAQSEPHAVGRRLVTVLALLLVVAFLVALAVLGHEVFTRSPSHPVPTNSGVALHTLEGVPATPVMACVAEGPA